MLAACVHHFLHLRLESLVKVLHPLNPLGLSLGDVIESLLHMGCEVVVHDVREVGHQKVVHHDTDVGRQQLALLGASHFLLGLLRYLDALQGIYGVVALHALLVTLHHVFALLDGADGWSVGRWTSDAEVFQFLHEAGLGVSCRSQGEFLGGDNLAALQLIAFLHGWQDVG